MPEIHCENPSYEREEIELQHMKHDMKCQEHSDKKTQTDSLNSVCLYIDPQTDTTDKAEEHQKQKEYINIFNFYHRVPQLQPLCIKLKAKETERIVKVVASAIAVSLYLTYFIAVLNIPHKMKNSDYWCDDDGFLIINTIFFGTLLFYFQVVKPYMNGPISKMVGPTYHKIKVATNTRKAKMIKYSIVIVCYVVFVALDTFGDSSRLVSAFGSLVLVGVAVIFSMYPTQIKYEQIIWGLGLQFAFGLAILRWSFGRKIFECLGAKVTAFLNFTNIGSTFVFGNFLDSTNSYAFKILPVILFFGLFVTVLYHYGILQWLIIKVGWILEFTMGTTPCESMGTAANIFLGMSEAPLVIRPYVQLLTKSEIHTVMTGGFATVAGGVLSAYISFGVQASHLLSASIMSAPAALAMSKVFYPETEGSHTKSEDIIIEKRKNMNILSAIVSDLKSNMPLIAIISSILIITLATTSFLNAVLNWTCQMLGYEEGVCEVQSGLGYLFSPVAWLMGVPWEDCFFVGYLLGIKVFISEFIAYNELMKRFKDGLISSRAVSISTYALCGFSSVSSIGCQVGALSCMAPARTKDITSVVLRAFVAGNFACFLTACMADLFTKFYGKPTPPCWIDSVFGKLSWILVVDLGPCGRRSSTWLRLLLRCFKDCLAMAEVE